MVLSRSLERSLEPSSVMTSSIRHVFSAFWRACTCEVTLVGACLRNLIGKLATLTSKFEKRLRLLRCLKGLTTISALQRSRAVVASFIPYTGEKIKNRRTPKVKRARLVSLMTVGSSISSGRTSPFNKSGREIHKTNLTDLIFGPYLLNAATC